MRIFYASDLHGSEPCFRKFINAARFYKVDVLILGGDLAGKAILPIVEQAGGAYRTTFMGRDLLLTTEAETAEIERHAKTAGLYPRRLTPGEASALSTDPAALERAFADAIHIFFDEWLSFAEDRLPEETECYVMPGNDDVPAVGKALNASETVLNVDGRIVTVGEEREMLSVGLSNWTPFHSPREVDDDELGRLVERLADRIKSPDKAIFNVHCPPYGTALDFAPAVDDNLRMVTHMGRPDMVHVGSQAVRTAIEARQPLLGLHGHCHESRAKERIGRTSCFNPGSEYVNGILRGVIITIRERKGQVAYQFVAA